MRYIFIHHALPTEMVSAISVYGQCIPLPPFEKLSHPVCAHPDMLMVNIDGTLLIHAEYTEGQQILQDLQIPFMLSHTSVEKEYPKDIRLNCFSVGPCFFAHRKGISTEALALAETKSLHPVFVKQGYAKCSSAIAGGAIATADQGIFRAAMQEHIPALLLNPYHIHIETYDTGFIGGAGFALDDKLFFFGKIESFPEYTELRDFFAKYGITLVSLSDDPLFDYGGAVVFET